MTVGDYTMFTPAQYYRLRERLGDAEAENARLKAELDKRCTNEREPSCPFGTCRYHCES